MSNPELLVVCASHSPGKDRDVAEAFGAEFRAGLSRAATLVREFRPDYIILFGGDHRRAFRTIVPAFAVVQSGGIMAEAGHPAAGLEVPQDRAREIAEHLLASGIDIAVCRDIELDHAFAQPLRDLTGSENRYPVVPIAINCATAPLPDARRVLALGDAVARFLAQRDDRVLIIGTGGLSHSPPSLEVDTYDISDEERARIIAEGMPAARGKIKPVWDREFLEALATWDRHALCTLTDNARAEAGAGANEVRTWLAAGAAGGGRPVPTLVYQPVPEWITGMAVAASG